MCAPKAESLLGIEGRVNSSKDDISPSLTSQFADLVPTQGIPRVYANAYDVATLDSVWIHATERFIDQYRIAERSGRSSRKHVKPARRDDGSAN
jgi:hypothetical protein